METRRSKSFSNNTSSACAPSSPTSSRARSLVFAMTLSLATACGTSPSNGTDGGTGDLDGGIGMDARTDIDAGPLGCTSDAECADAIDCTSDTCVVATGACRHTVTPALCAVGESCNPLTGCELGRPCATDEDCADDDACTTMERCDPAARVCMFVPLDGDADGDPPRVCGGGDCDDSNAAVFGGADEECGDLIDNDCDGAVDETVPTAPCAEQLSCRHEATCDWSTPASADEFYRACLPASTLDRLTCTNLAEVVAAVAACVADTACERDCARDTISGVCECPATLTLCAAGTRTLECVDLLVDAQNCGACGRRCPWITPTMQLYCVGGECDCPGSDTLCGEACVDLEGDTSNCGACGRVCPSGSTCVGGTCSCPGGETVCADACVDTDTDPVNCGTCGRNCGSTMACVGGTCVACGMAGQPCCAEMFGTGACQRGLTCTAGVCG